MLIVETDTFLVYLHAHDTNRPLLRSIPMLTIQTGFFTEPHTLGTNQWRKQKISEGVQGFVTIM